MATGSSDFFIDGLFAICAHCRSAYLAENRNGSWVVEHLKNWNRELPECQNAGKTFKFPRPVLLEEIKA